MLRTLFLICISILVSAAPLHAADDVYQTPEDFVAESFAKAHSAKTLNMTPELLKKAKKIMGSHYTLGDLKYWTDGQKTVWILEDIGKYKPITTGYAVSGDGTIERVKVLIYRESHGWEVKHKFFTRQFKGAALKREKKLDKRIDGIAGATLSVNALKRMGALAVMLHENRGS